jgi:hypothetical protein
VLPVAVMKDEAAILRRERTVADLASELGVAAGTILPWSNGGVRAIVPVRVVPDDRSTTRTSRLDGAWRDVAFILQGPR